MISPPRRDSVVDQVTQVLRQGLQNREWAEHLPGERRLCTELQVSRSTLRKALAVLRDEGLIEVSHGHYSKIKGQARRPTRRAPPRIIGFLSDAPLYDAAFPGHVVYLLSELQSQFHDSGFECIQRTDRRLQTKDSNKILETLVKETEVACWVLVSMSETIQRWFFDRKIPTVVFGTSFEGVSLPSIDVNYRALGHHAACTLLRKGHRRIALLMAKTERAGDFACEQGFRAGFKDLGLSDISPIVPAHDRSLDSIRKALSSLLHSPNPPTGILIARAAHVIAFLGQMLQLGMRLPDDVSLISRDDDSLFQYFVPSLARYTVNRVTYVNRFRRLVLQVVAAQTSVARSVRIMPQFVEGETLASPKAKT